MIVSCDEGDSDLTQIGFDYCPLTLIPILLLRFNFTSNALKYGQALVALVDNTLLLLPMQHRLVLGLLEGRVDLAGAVRRIMVIGQERNRSIVAQNIMTGTLQIEERTELV